MASLGEGFKTSSNELNKECAKPSSAPKNESGLKVEVTSVSFTASFEVSFTRASFGASLGGVTGLGASRVLLMT